MTWLEGLRPGARRGNQEPGTNNRAVRGHACRRDDCCSMVNLPPNRSELAPLYDSSDIIYGFFRQYLLGSRLRLVPLGRPRAANHLRSGNLKSQEVPEVVLRDFCGNAPFWLISSFRGRGALLGFLGRQAWLDFVGVSDGLNTSPPDSRNCMVWSDQVDAAYRAVSRNADSTVR